jgi:hypothetical protein
VYQVCKQHHTALGRDKCTAHAQQRCSLLALGNKHDPCPIKHFHKDLNYFLKMTTAKGDLIVLFGNFNEVLWSDLSRILKLAWSYDCVNIMHTHHQQPHPATCARGKDCMDYVWVSTPIQHAMSTCGYEPFNKIFCGDHHGYFVDFEVSQVFGNELQHLASLPFCNIWGMASNVSLNM